MKPSRLLGHMETKDSGLKDKPLEFFLKEKNELEGRSMKILSYMKPVRGAKKVGDRCCRVSGCSIFYIPVRNIKIHTILGYFTITSCESVRSIVLHAIIKKTSRHKLVLG